MSIYIHIWINDNKSNKTCTNTSKIYDDLVDDFKSSGTDGNGEEQIVREGFRKKGLLITATITTKIQHFGTTKATHTHTNIIYNMKY